MPGSHLGRAPAVDHNRTGEVLVRAVRLVLFSEGRHRWRAWLALVVLVALVSGVVMAASAAARRTNTAFPRFTQSYGVDAIAYSYAPLRGLATRPDIASYVDVTTPAGGTPRCTCGAINPSYFSVNEAAPATLRRLSKLVSGRLPDPSAPTEVLASFSLAQQAGLHVGSVVTVPFFAPDQQAAATGAASARPTGPVVAFHVVGIEAAEYEFPSVGTPSFDLWATPAFARTFHNRVFAFHLTFVRLRGGATDQGRFQAEATRMGALGFGDEDVAAAEIESSLHPQAVGWWLLALFAGTAGLLAAAQAFARQTRVASETYPALSALGLGSSELIALNIGRALVVGVGGAALGVVLAVALSPLAPVGEARTADPSTGLALDPLVIGIGVGVTVIAAVLVCLWPAISSSRVRRVEAAAPRSSGVVNWLAALGAPPAVVVGVRRALERGRGRDAVPVGTALLGTAAAVLALTATSVFGASLSHLTATPTLYGQKFDVYFGGGTNPTEHAELFGPMLRALRTDPRIAAVTMGASSEVTINNRAVDAIAGTPLRGPLLLSKVDGALPAGPGEVAVGQGTLHQVGAHIGSLVKVDVLTNAGGSRRSTFRVVGTVSFPTAFGIGGLGDGAIFTIAGLVDAQCAPLPAGAACRAANTRSDPQVLLVAGVPGAGGRAAIAQYERRYPGYTNVPLPPNNLVNFGEAVNFPLIIGVVLALFGAATLLHMLVVSAARRRPETGLLKALGFVRSQVAAAVAWQATTIALVGVVVGIPLGIALGQGVWRAFAGSLGVVPDPVVTAWVIATVAVGVVVLANLLALGPALISARLRPAELLRIE